jgi:precorrin-3B synthase
MMSGDGLVVRVRPMLGRFSAKQALGICALAERFGSGTLDLTSRANLQIRGVSEDGHEPLLEALNALELLPDDPAYEARRNILIAPDWVQGDDSAVIAAELTARLSEFPELTAKFGFAVDAGPAPVLCDDSADIRLERGKTGLILRADGAELGAPTSVETAVDQMIEMATWFSERKTPELRRMQAVLTQYSLPDVWTTTAPNARRAEFTPGEIKGGVIYGAAFGQINARALTRLIETSGATALRTTPWRLFLLEDAVPCSAEEFITHSGDPRLNIDACPGAPMCTSSSVKTHRLAHSLAGLTDKHLHVSGCPKGCARARPSSLTLIGRDGTFDLVKDGHAWDAPVLTGLTPNDLKTRIGEF